MKSACPGLDHARDMLVIARETLGVARLALEAVRRIEALAEVPGASRDLIIAAAAARELRAPLEAHGMSAELLIAARQAGYREGTVRERAATDRGAGGAGTPAPASAARLTREASAPGR